jgi:hypothetical protein
MAPDRVGLPTCVIANHDLALRNEAPDARLVWEGV